ncbi:MAG: adenosylcobinamide-GDP ribazoletransferase [Actinomycetota bacterium]
MTRLPTGATERSGHDVGRAVAWFPFVGAMVGLAVGATYLAASEITEPLVAAALGVGVGAAVTGTFHEDGLGDVADGFGGGWTPERRLEIMRDSRLGTYGTVAIGLSLLVRVAALAALPAETAVASTVVVHALARTWPMLALGLGRSARAAGLGSGLRPPARRAPSWISAAITLVLAVLLVGPAQAGLVTVVGVGACALTAALAYRKIGGITGDVLGAMEQGAEALGLVAAGASRG